MDADVNDAMMDMIKTFSQGFEEMTLEHKKIYVRNIIKQINVTKDKTLESLVLVNGDIIKF